jgi:hypothetical protein
MNTKLQSIILVVAVFAVGYGILYFINRNGRREQRAADSIYYSFQERMLPSGRILRKTVEERGGEWTKTMVLLDRNGMIVQTKSAPMGPDVCRKVENGKFVPDLWSDCSVEY